jgi:hypothetical protein
MGIDFLLSDGMRARLLKAGVPEEQHNRKDLQALLLDGFGSTASRELSLEELAEVIVYLSERRSRG